MVAPTMTGKSLVAGSTTGQVLHSDVPLSFWGGVDPSNGVVIDKHHPLCGQSLTGRIVAIPGGRGSCGGSATIFEMLLNDTAPAALVFSQSETILTIGVVIAEELFDRSIPVLRVDEATLTRLASATTVTIRDGIDHGWRRRQAGSPSHLRTFLTQLVSSSLRARSAVPGRRLRRSSADRHADRASSRRSGGCVTAYRRRDGAHRWDLLSRAGEPEVRHHATRPWRPCPRPVDARTPSVSTGSGGKSHGVPVSMGEPSEQLADAYLQMGVEPTYTCAPYLLRERPRFGQQIASGESIAVVYFNSVIGARTMKYPNYLDILLAITGRAPDAVHRGRRPKTDRPVRRSTADPHRPQTSTPSSAITSERLRRTTSP